MYFCICIMESLHHTPETNQECMLSCSVVSHSLQPRGLQPTRLLCPWDSPGKNAGVGCHFLLQGIVPAQGSNPRPLHLLHWQADSLLLHHLGSHQSSIKGVGRPVTWLCFHSVFIEGILPAFPRSLSNT